MFVMCMVVWGFCDAPVELLGVQTYRISEHPYKHTTLQIFYSKDLIPIFFIEIFICSAES